MLLEFSFPITVFYISSSYVYAIFVYKTYLKTTHNTRKYYVGSISATMLG